LAIDDNAIVPVKQMVSLSVEIPENTIPDDVPMLTDERFYFFPKQGNPGRHRSCLISPSTEGTLKVEQISVKSRFMG
jgi:hypothetical protein